MIFHGPSAGGARRRRGEGPGVLWSCVAADEEDRPRRVVPDEVNEGPLGAEDHRVVVGGGQRGAHHDDRGRGRGLRALFRYFDEGLVYDVAYINVVKSGHPGKVGGVRVECRGHAHLRQSLRQVVIILLLEFRQVYLDLLRGHRGGPFYQLLGAQRFFQCLDIGFFVGKQHQH